MPTTPLPSPVARRAGRGGGVPVARITVMAVATAALVLVVLVGPAAVAGVAPGAVPSACASAADGATVGLVVDFGTLPDSPGRIDQRCVPVASRATGVDVLLAVYGRAGVRLDGSGLVCAIGGYPASGCGDRTSSGYRYWSYWHGGSSWTYASAGPAYVRPGAGAVEGWHFVEAGGNPADPPPRASATGPCPPPAPPSTAPSTVAGGAVGGSGTQPGAGGPAGAAPSSTASPADGRPSGPSDQAGAPLTGATPSPAGSGPAPAVDGSGEAALGDGTGPIGATGTAGSGRSGGVPAGVVAVAVAALGLGVAAGLRFRARPEP